MEKARTHYCEILKLYAKIFLIVLLSIRRVLVLNEWHAGACQTRTREQIKEFISLKFSANENDLEFRKMIVNTFIREIVFFEDKLLITYNFSAPTEPVAIDVKLTKEIEKQSESAFSFTQKYSSIFPKGAPKEAQGSAFLQKNSVRDGVLI